jgi:hypothetical protein
MQLDLNKKYQTRDGHEVILHEYVPLNSVGAKVTFPFKGTVRKLVNVRYTNKYCIWTETGAARVLAPHNDDLVEV